MKHLFQLNDDGGNSVALIETEHTAEQVQKAWGQAYEGEDPNGEDYFDDIETRMEKYGVKCEQVWYDEIDPIP